MFLEHLRRTALVETGDAVLVAVSGGPDSVALLHLLRAVRPVLRCGIAVAHANFTLRAAASDADEAFVCQMCDRLGLVCHVRRFATRSVAASWKKSIEETARIQRYAFFDELCRDHGYDRIATGHHLGDNAETLLFNLFRGVSPGGLHGVRARNGKVIRPLLPFDRPWIMAYLHERELCWRTDSTNMETGPDRNFIRHRVIPVVAERFGDKLLPSLYRFSEQAAELDAFVGQHVAGLIASNPLLDPKGGRLHVVSLQRLSVFERKELLKRALRVQGGVVDSRVLQRLDALLQCQPGRCVPVGNGVSVTRKDGFLVFSGIGRG